MDANQDRWHARITNVSLKRNAATEETTVGMVQTSLTVEEVGFLFFLSLFQTHKNSDIKRPFLKIGFEKLKHCGSGHNHCGSA